MGHVLQDQLFEVQESALVVDLLTDLDNRVPGVLGLDFAAIWTLLASNDNLKNVGLLEDGRGKHFFLHRQLDLDALAVGLCPQEARIH
jgi:hypothetical protein